MPVKDSSSEMCERIDALERLVLYLLYNSVDTLNSVSDPQRVVAIASTHPNTEWVGVWFEQTVEEKNQDDKDCDDDTVKGWGDL